MGSNFNLFCKVFVRFVSSVYLFFILFFLGKDFFMLEKFLLLEVLFRN